MTTDGATTDRATTDRATADRATTEHVGAHAWVRVPRRLLLEGSADRTVEVSAVALAEHPGAVLEWLAVGGCGEPGGVSRPGAPRRGSPTRA
ncbi:hypothetical protein LY71_12216 [Geodermatophilus tzadiensis]|uniref:Uncharacterized protein n=1 Tax=Geodermatophilus tzadiensis TaxID=1137988 RepID=A0A2T0SYR3_9ACTN|nr:hypothetical protein [Geodermatophilus tzadiensis]PRY38544.1 hypothetical protein LY71_12216 [Geodermatophilus tzadiensis]